MKVRFVGGPQCGHEDTVEPQTNGKPPTKITPSRANGGVYRLRAKDASHIVPGNLGYRFYDWGPAKPAKPKPAA